MAAGDADDDAVGLEWTHDEDYKVDDDYKDEV